MIARIGKAVDSTYNLGLEGRRDLPGLQLVPVNVTEDGLRSDGSLRAAGHPQSLVGATFK